MAIGRIITTGDSKLDPCMMMNSEKIFMIRNENGKKTYYLHSYKSEDIYGMRVSG